MFASSAPRAKGLAGEERAGLGGGRMSGGKRGVQVRLATGRGGGWSAGESRSARASPRPAALDSLPRARSQDPSHLFSSPSAPERAKRHLWNEGRPGEKEEGKEGGQRRRGVGRRARAREGRGRGRGDSGGRAGASWGACGTEPGWRAGRREFRSR